MADRTSRRAASQRAALVETLRADRVAGDAVLAAMAAVPRERFVPRAERRSAHEDRPLSIGHGATISQPRVVARMLELAEVGPGARVLDVGGGSGYAAAVAAQLGCAVTSVELVPELAERARATLASLDLPVQVVVGDGWAGWPDGAPWDAVLVAAAAPEVPAALTEQLADGGRLVLPVGLPRRRQQLVRIIRTAGSLRREDHGAVRFVPLVARHDETG